MEFNKYSLPIRIVIALALGIFVLKLIFHSGQPLSPADKMFGLFLMMFYGVALFLLFGWSMITAVGDKFASLYVGSDKDIRVMPEYGVAEARAAVGKYQEAVDEYRKVIIDHPEDIYPHLRIAEMAVKNLDDVKLAELELLSAVGKAAGADSIALATGRLADLYQLTLDDPAKALEVMKQVRERIPDTKQAKLAEERIAVLEGIVHTGVPLSKPPEKLAHRPSRFRLDD